MFDAMLLSDLANKFSLSLSLSTIACRSHSGFSFVHSTMTTGCDATCRVVHCCQPRLV